MSKPAIKVERLSKQFRIGVDEAIPSTWHQAVLRTLASPFAYLRETMRPPNEAEIIWALRDVSFTVEEGDVLGIVGPNGAGKSTLLKILSRITYPTEGRVTIAGRIGALLEVGTGFHPDLTGRENIYLSGTILGMKKREIDQKLDEIIAFAELEKFIDTPIKRYSSGMGVRLGFAVAAHLDPEILILDEVLSVGDESFRRKCVAKMQSAAEDGRTVLFVSHNLPSLADLCPHSIWISKGQIVQHGETTEIIQAYLGSLVNETARRMEKNSSRAASGASTAAPILQSKADGFTIEEIILQNAARETVNVFAPGDELCIQVKYNALAPIEKPSFILSVQSMFGTCFGVNMLLDGNTPDLIHGRGLLTCRFKHLPLMPQNYTISIAVRTNRGPGTHIDTIIGRQEIAHFAVRGDLTPFGFHGKLFDSLVSRSFPLFIPYEWEFADGRVAKVSSPLFDNEITS
ncbi:MAG: hypothetical protein DCC52_00010 [Chloroflexi bacterium]|nr:MAG: hypothetical protein DCC52_00010 [Chloroflexota bacterium]